MERPIYTINLLKASDRGQELEVKYMSTYENENEKTEETEWCIWVASAYAVEDTKDLW